MDGLLRVSLLPGVCTGDCDENGEVGSIDLELAVRIALGQLPTSSCLSLDISNDVVATVEEIVSAVAKRQSNCL